MRRFESIRFARTYIRSFAQDERGASAIEYGLIAGLVAVGLVAALTLVGANLTDTFDSIATALGSSGSGGDAGAGGG